MKSNDGIDVCFFSSTSDEKTFYDDLSKVESSILSTINEDNNIAKELIDDKVAELRRYFVEFLNDLTRLEIHALLACFSRNSQLMVDFFRVWDQNLSCRRDRSYTEFLNIIAGRHILGYYYKLAYGVLIEQSNYSFQNIHQTLAVDSDSAPPIKIFLEKANADILKESV
jgi:hypothetical protein